MAAKNVFGYCITELKLYQTVYGVMAMIPMTVLWIYITWLIVLFGLQLTFTTQHLKTLDAAEIAARVLGRSGTLRAPAARVGDAWVVGFTEEMWSAVLG